MSSLLTLICILCGSLTLSNLPFVSADCPSPKIPNHIYALTKASSLYTTGAVFDIVCMPGYGSSNVVHLRCNADGNWLGNWPACSKDENQAKWWMLLLGMVGVVLLVPCILPRLYFTFIDTSSPRKDWTRKKGAKTSNHGSDRIRMQPFSSKPVESRAPAPSQPHHIHDISPRPLPPIRRQIDHTINDKYFAA